MELDAGLSDKIGAFFGMHNIHSSITLARDTLHFYCSECGTNVVTQIKEVIVNNRIVATEVPSK